MIIYFFKDRSKERINFEELIDGYFDKLENVVITSTEDELTATFYLPQFECSYKYLITKRARVSSIYKLNPNYVNTFLFCELPSDVPQFITRTMLKQVDELCRMFDLAIYHDRIDNIAEFNMFDLIKAFSKEREQFLHENKDVVKYPVSQDLLNEVCAYEAIRNELPSVVKDDIVASPYIVLKDNEDHIYFSVNWRVGYPATFPPQLDFVQIEEEENLVNLVPVHVFYKYVEKSMHEIKDNSWALKIRYLNETSSLKARKYIRKMRKSVLSTYKYEVLKLTDLIEK